MNLTETPDVVNWPPTHYVFVEKKGPFMESAPAAWGELHALTSAIAEHNKITEYLSLYKIDPKGNTYRAGVAVAEKPAKLPAGVEYEPFSGGKYSRFVLMGPYSNLPQACGRVFEIVEKSKLPLRADWNIEHYCNDPRVTPAEQLRTEIMVPTA